MTRLSSAARQFRFLTLGLLASGAALAQNMPSGQSPDFYLLRAQQLRTEGNLPAAGLHYDEYLRHLPAQAMQPANVTEASYYSLVGRLRGNDPTAAHELEAFADASPATPYAQLANFELGKQAFEEKRWEKAVSYLSKIDLASLNGEERGQAGFYKGYALLTLKEFDKAEEPMRTAAAGDHKYAAQASYYSAYLGLRSGRYDEALGYLKKAEEDKTLRPYIPLLRANLYYRQKKYDQVLAEAKASSAGADSKLPGLEDMQLLEGEAYFNKGDLKAAQKSYTAYQARVRATPPKPVALHFGFAALANGQADKAIPMLTAAAGSVDTAGGKRDTVAQSAGYHLGIAYVNKKNYPFAYNAFLQARQTRGVDSIQEAAYLNSGLMLLAQERYDAARQTMEAFKVAYPNSDLEEEADETISESYLYGSDYDLALQHFKKMRSRSPKVLSAYQRVLYQKGVRLFNEGKPGEALSFLTQAAEQNQRLDVTQASRFWAGEAASADKQYAEAQKQYSAFFQLPGAERSDLYLPARFGIGYAYYNQRQYPKALPHFREYVERNEGKQAQFYPQALLRLADCYYATKDYARAGTTYDKALVLRGADTEYILYQKSVVSSTQGKSDEAGQLLGRLLKEYPNTRFKDQALYQQAQINLDAGKYEEAISGFTRVITSTQDPGITPFAYLKRAVAYSNLKQADKASADYKMILDEYSRSAAADNALVGLQESLSAEGKSEDFLPYLQKFKDQNPDAGSTEGLEFEAAKGLYFSQKYAKAAASFEAFVKAYPNNSQVTEAEFYIGESYYRLNDREKAMEGHRAVVADGRSNFLMRSLQRMGEMTHTGGDYPESNRYYGQMYKLARNIKEHSTALAGMMENYYDLGRFDSSAILADQILAQENPPLDQANKAALFRGKVALAQNDYERATNEFLSTLNTAMDISGAEAQYLLGEVLYKEKKYRESLNALYLLPQNFAQYQRWIDRGFLLIADNFIALDDKYQATATLNSIIAQSPDKKTKDAAKTRLDALKGTGSDEKPVE